MPWALWCRSSISACGCARCKGGAFQWVQTPQVGGLWVVGRSVGGQVRRWMGGLMGGFVSWWGKII